MQGIRELGKDGHGQKTHIREYTDPIHYSDTVPITCNRLLGKDGHGQKPI